MKNLFRIIVLFITLSCGAKQPEAAKNTDQTVPSSDVKAVALAERMMDAMGGAKAWNETRYLRFDFVVETDGKEISRHSHVWDKFSGRYRVQGKTRDGKAYDILYDDIHKKSGKPYVDGRLAESKESEDKLQYGYNRFINDTYWLLMPWKLKDPGVTLRYEGLQKDSLSGKSYEVVHLAFEQVGLTPKDQYWAFINPETFLMEKWKFRLQGGEEGFYDWKNWKEYGVLKFSEIKTDVGGKRSIKTEHIAISGQMNDEVFTHHDAVLP
jgi:hypothetical protein